MNIFKILKKSFVLILIISVLAVLIMPLNASFAATKKYTQTLKSGISNFPKEYQSALNKIKDKHPNWNFEAYYTGIPWSTVLLNETSSHGRNRVIKTADASWRCSCGNVASGYACASEGIIGYHLDARNFLNEINIFQFLEISYNSKIHNLSGVKSAVKGTFLDNTITYRKNGKSYTKSYAEIILEAAEESNMSPYSIVTKIIQEVGTNGSASVKGTYSGYKGYYNFYNLGAYDTGNAIVNALKYAKDKGWDNQYDAIIDGAKQISNSYTNAGQNTAYFYKWDVVGTKILKSGSSQKVSSSDMFWHQYMTNVQDPTSQSKPLYNTYARNGVLDKSLNFIIPIYEDMPSSVDMPSGFSDDTEDLYYVNCTDGLRVRNKASTSGSILATLYKNTKVQMITKNYTTANGIVWDKIKLSNGVTGYTADKYLTVCKTNNDSDTVIGTAKTTENLKLRKSASTSGVLLAIIPKNTQVDILQKDVSNSNGYNWYKVKYGSYKGYVASQYLNVNNSNNNNNNNDNKSDEIKLNDEYAKVDGSTLIVKPTSTIKNIANSASGTLKTGETVKVGSKSYTVAMLGDINGDGVIDSRDSLRILKYQVGKYNLNVNGKLAADLNGDGVVDSRDSLRILKYQVGKYKLDSDEKLAADINDDGVIDSRDSLRILKYQVGKYKITLD